MYMRRLAALAVFCALIPASAQGQVVALACEDQDPNPATRSNMLLGLDHGRRVATLLSESPPLVLTTVRWDDNVIEYRAVGPSSFVLNRHTGEIRTHHPQFGISKWICKISKPGI
jgi:hypothetical protein